MISRVLFTVLMLAASCAPRREYHAVFTEGQTHWDMLTEDGLEPVDSAYQALYEFTPPDPIGFGPRTLSIRLPRSPAPESGRSYAEDTPGFGFTLDGLEYTCFALDSGSSFGLALTRWGGSGGLAAGSFAGKLVDSSSAPIREVTNVTGTFEAKIR